MWCGMADNYLIGYFILENLGPNIRMQISRSNNIWTLSFQGDEFVAAILLVGIHDLQTPHNYSIVYDAGSKISNKDM